MGNLRLLRTMTLTPSPLIKMRKELSLLLPGLKLLVVDDDPETLLDIWKWIPTPGISFELEIRPALIMETIRRFRPNVVLISASLKNYNGLTICNALKRQDETRMLPIILMGDLSIDPQLVVDTGASYFLEKPVDPVILSDALRDVATNLQVTGKM